MVSIYNVFKDNSIGFIYKKNVNGLYIYIWVNQTYILYKIYFQYELEIHLFQVHWIRFFLYMSNLSIEWALVMAISQQYSIALSSLSPAFPFSLCVSIPDLSLFVWETLVVCICVSLAEIQEVTKQTGSTRLCFGCGLPVLCVLSIQRYKFYLLSTDQCYQGHVRNLIREVGYRQ